MMPSTRRMLALVGVGLVVLGFAIGPPYPLSNLFGGRWFPYVFYAAGASTIVWAVIPRSRTAGWVSAVLVTLAPATRASTLLFSLLDDPGRSLFEVLAPATHNLIFLTLALYVWPRARRELEQQQVD